MNKKTVILVTALLTLFTNDAAAKCEENCSKKCYKKTLGVKYDDPVCRAACEARRQACNRAGIDVPSIPMVTDPSMLPPDPIQIFYGECARPFEAVTGFIRTYCKNSGSSTQLENFRLSEAKRLLLASGHYRDKDFSGVRVRWCKLNGADGMSPDRGEIFLDTDMLGAESFQIAALLAHELQHERQWRRHGDKFPCKYSEAYVGCSGCKDNNNRFEKEAYAAGDKMQRMLSQFASYCYVQGVGMCPIIQNPTEGFLFRLFGPCSCVLPNPYSGNLEYQSGTGLLQ